MRTKRSIKDEFEKVYLRFNQAQRDLPKASLEEMKGRDFKRVCRYTANKSFYSNQAFLSMSGFDYDDIYSLSLFYGACFLGYKSKDDALDTRRYYLMMTASIMQRLNRFISWTANKMQSSEVVDRISIDAVIDENKTPDLSFGFFCSDLYEKNEESVAPEEQLGLIEEKIELLEKIKINPPENKKRITNSITKLKHQAKKIRSSLLKEKKEKNKLFKVLRKKLNENPHKYEQTLVYYACTKHVSFDIRKAARRYCDKFGIDYKKAAASSVSVENNKKDYII